MSSARISTPTHQRLHPGPPDRRTADGKQPACRNGLTRGSGSTGPGPPGTPTPERSAKGCTRAKCEVRRLAGVTAKGIDDLLVTTDINTLLTAPYVKIDDRLGKPRTGRPPKPSDAELLTPAVAQPLPGIRSEARRLRFLPSTPTRRAPLPARPARLHQTPASRVTAVEERHPPDRRGHRPAVRRRMSHRPHPRRMRPIPTHHQTLRTGRLRPRPPLLEFTILLGACAYT
jgi:hypothetical protein